MAGLGMNPETILIVFKPMDERAELRMSGIRIEVPQGVTLDFSELSASSAITDCELVVTETIRFMVPE